MIENETVRAADFDQDHELLYTFEEKQIPLPSIKGNVVVRFASNGDKVELGTWHATDAYLCRFVWDVPKKPGPRPFWSRRYVPCFYTQRGYRAARVQHVPCVYDACKSAWRRTAVKYPRAPPSGLIPGLDLQVGLLGE